MAHLFKENTREKGRFSINLKLIYESVGMNVIYNSESLCGN